MMVRLLLDAGADVNHHDGLFSSACKPQSLLEIHVSNKCCLTEEQSQIMLGGGICNSFAGCAKMLTYSTSGYYSEEPCVQKNHPYIGRDTHDDDGADNNSRWGPQI